ncbi:MAG: aquaporin, partial [Thermomicrobiales bacterium]|nr:aquaporin [Thermomicrobiales bacterium]
QQDFTNFWIWIVGPIVGALIAAFLYQGVLLKGVREEPPTMRIAAPPTPVAPPPPPPTPRRRSSRR